MEKIIIWLRWLCAAAGGLLGAFLGELDGMLTALCFFVAADFITGVAAACVEGTLSSKTSFAGIARKVCIFLLVGMANVIDLYLLGQGSAVRTAALSFYLAGEGISLLENGARIGLPIPPAVRAFLDQVR